MLAQVVSVVWLATRPAPVIADTALDALCPTTLGTEAQGPVEMTRLTGVLGATLAPTAGLCPVTLPVETWLVEQALVCVPTVRPARARTAPALLGDWPRTLGTDTEVCVPDTVRAIGTLALILEPPAGS